jgi:hypothetical protein
MNARFALYGGMGYPLTETPAGMPAMARHLQGFGVECQIFAHDARQEGYNYLHAFAGVRGLVGDSLGAGSSALFADDIKGLVDFVGGFQPSDWDPIGKGPINNRYIVVAPNVRYSHCIWDPYFLDTFGLGNAHYVIAPGAKTILSETRHRGAHPDDWGYAQDVMLAHIEMILKQATK